MPQRYFTLAEAQALLPRLRGLLDALRTARDQAVVKRARIDSLWKRLGAGESVLARLGDEQRQVDALTTRLTALAREIEEIGCLIRDIDAGLVDFPARARGGTPVFLCWRRGEAAIEFWHGVEEGFAGRKPLADLRWDEA